MVELDTCARDIVGTVLSRLWNVQVATGTRDTGPRTTPVILSKADGRQMNMSEHRAAIPELWPPASRTFYTFAVDGKVEFGWDKDGFRITQASIVRTRLLHLFPLTKAGWTEAWQTMESDYPTLAAKIASRVGTGESELERLTKYAVVSGCTFLGGNSPDGAALVPETPCTMYFTDHGLWVTPPSGYGFSTLLRIPFNEMTDLELSGPGKYRDTGTMVVGYLAFGVIGAVAATNIKTVIKLQGADKELFFSCNTTTPQELRVQLSAPLGRIQAARTAPEAPMDGSIIGELERLVELHRTGALSDDEFAALKAKVISAVRQETAHEEGGIGGQP